MLSFTSVLLHLFLCDSAVIPFHEAHRNEVDFFAAYCAKLL